MKITKFGHSCLLVETNEPITRSILFDPGTLSHIEPAELNSLDDILITHVHEDHLDKNLILKLQSKFPATRIMAPSDARSVLEGVGISNVVDTSEGVELFTSPHEAIRPYFDSDPPVQHGYHLLDKLTHPGDSHSFDETKSVLALPVQAPWGSLVNAVSLGLKLKPKYILPIHDWHWSVAARQQTYQRLEQVFAKNDITFVSLQDGIPTSLDV